MRLNDTIKKYTMTTQEALCFIISNPGEEIQDVDDNKWRISKYSCASNKEIEQRFIMEYFEPESRRSNQDILWSPRSVIRDGIKYRVYPEGTYDWAIVQMLLGKIITWGEGGHIFRFNDGRFQERSDDVNWRDLKHSNVIDYEKKYRVVEDFPFVYNKEEQIRDYERILYEVSSCVDNEHAGKAITVLKKYNVIA